MYNYNFLEQVKNLLFCEYQLKTMEVRNLNEQNINLRNQIQEIKFMKMNNGENQFNDFDKIISENKNLKNEIRNCNVRLLKLNQQSIVSQLG